MRVRRILGGVSALGALAGLSYLGYVGLAYRRYGHTTGVDAAEPDSLLDGFIPAPEVRERHAVRVAAPADATWEAARALDLRRSPLVQAIFRARELVFGTADDRARPRTFVDEVLAIGWGVLVDEPGRQMVFGAVTEPWRGDVRFRALPPGDFAAYAEPGHAKILWTLAVDSLGPGASRFRTETRAMTTDATSRERFRRYWSAFSPGILLIRLEALRLVKRDAEARARTARGGAAAPANAPDPTRSAVR
jgi:hypothetical protein